MHKNLKVTCKQIRTVEMDVQVVVFLREGVSSSGKTVHAHAIFLQIILRNSLGTFI